MTPFEEILKLIPQLGSEEYGRLRHIVTTRPWWLWQHVDREKVGTNVVGGSVSLTEHKGEGERSR